ncbi:MAG: glycosyltransferase family 39 protein, partial [Planctomycetota bacterium]|nr:glycosyltransferase family 39 protein [Planctomycetota bacterium]
LNGSPYLNKPPLMYWSIALAMQLFGICEFAARLPGALYAWFGVIVAWHWASRLWGRQAGRLAAGMLTVSVGWFLFAHQAMIDAQLSFFVFWSMYLLWRCTQEPHRGIRWLALYLVLALALFAKGPVGMLFTLIAGLGLVIARKRYRLIWQSRFHWGLVVMVAPLLLWTPLVEQRVPGFLEHFMKNEVWYRILNKRWPPDYTVSQVGVLGYLGVTAVWCAPWTLFLPQTARFAWLSAFAPGDADDPEVQARRDGVLLLILGVLGPTLVFLPMASRLIYYSLPAVPCFAVLSAGWWLSDEARADRRSKDWLVPALTLLAAGTAAFSAGFWVLGVVSQIPEIAVSPEVQGMMPPMAWWFGGAMLAASFFLFAKRPRAAAAWMILLMTWAWMDAGEGFMKFEDVRSSRNLVQELAPQLGPDCQWVAEGSNELGASAGIAFYLGADASGHPRTVRVLDDDRRRPQPSFGEAPRDWAITLPQLRSLWQSPRPAVFVTDPMRRDFAAPVHEPLYYERANEAGQVLIERNLPMLGEPLPKQWGFRRVYLNPAARARLNP